MKKLAMFVPLVKADAAQRLVYGIFDETPDAAREVFDYASSKPLFKAWSDRMDKASEGKSLGNIRGQHNPQIAAGKLVSMVFDDMKKAILFCARIVDDAEWQKVEEGVYTGFSPGGSYARRWRDGEHMRYTANPRELSIVDVPCNPSATFTMVKSDGSEAEIALLIARAYEPGNEATKARAELLAKAAGPDERARDFVVQARAALIAEQAAAELEKLADCGEEDEPEADEAPAEDLPTAEAKDELTQDNERLSKALNEIAPQIEVLTKVVETLTADRGRDQETISSLRKRLREIESQPVLEKGMRLAPEKGLEVLVLSQRRDDEALDLVTRLNGERDPMKRAQLVLNAVR